jgi:predicted ATPase/DNA-binding winged helix-turn-helix (wHTH) protein
MSTEAAKGVEKDQGEVAAFGPFLLFPGARQLQRDGKPVEIGGRALEVLIELVKQAGRVVSKAELLSAIWADTTVVEGVLRTHVCNVRKALGDGVNGSRYITSVAGRGYCFVAPVVRRAMEETRTSSSGVRPHTRSIIGNATRGLPPRLARMAGRDDVVRALAAQVLEHRFVTILGAAGIGKTTVAVAVGHALLDEFDGALCFLELGSVTDKTLVAATLASKLGLPVRTDEPLKSLQAFLRDKRILLVLDNCEHIVGELAALAERLFQHAPRVHLLTTSREALRVEGERVHRLGPLDTPVECEGIDAETVQTYSAAHVFLERAAASGWSGDLTDADVPMVVETCRRLDGVPLALELCASFVREFGLQGMTAVLDERLRFLLRRGRRTAPARQQTILALIAWSYDRLPEHERVALRRLSVFVGTFSFEAAKTVVLDGGDPTALLETMNELVNKSLLSCVVEDGAVLYRLLETTRVYALDQLGESGELDPTSLRHALLVIERLERATDAGSREALRKRSSALGNIRAALKWCFTSTVGYEAGTRLAAAAARLLLDFGLLTECRDVCRRALDVMSARDAGTPVEFGLQEAFAISAMYSTGNDDEVRLALERGRELARTMGRTEEEVRMLGELSILFIRRGDYRNAMEVSLIAGRVAEIDGTVSADWILGATHHLCGHQVPAQRHCEAALKLCTQGKMPEVPIGHFPRFNTMLALARTLWLRGYADRAVAIARQTIQESAEVNDPVFTAVHLIFGEAVFIWCGEWQEADHILHMLAAHVERYSLGLYRHVTMALRGEYCVRTGRPDDGCALLQQAIATLAAQRYGALATGFMGALGEGLAATGLLEKALDAVGGGIAEARRRGETFDLPELLRLKGSILASRSPGDARAVDETLSSAIELARRQGALAWELRATMALARERLRRGGSAVVLDDLATVYEQFSEGMRTPDLQAARSLLERRVER